MMEAARTSETSVDNHFTRQYNPEDNCTSYSSLMMEAVRTSETSVDNHFTRQYNPEDNCTSYSSVVMEAVSTSETSVDNHFTRQYNPEDSSEHYTRRRENLKSHLFGRSGAHISARRSVTLIEAFCGFT
jgi:hypothetical protein